MYKWQQIKALRGKGMRIKSIAKRLKVSKNTVRRYVRSIGPPAFQSREYEKMLDGYGDEIKEMLSKRYIGTRIFRELSRTGYEGSLSTVHRYIREAREKDEISSKVTTRVETPPGKQMQYDWKEWNLPVDGNDVKIYLHEVILSYSRKKYYTYSLSITTSDVIRAIAEAIEFFGGIAVELVIDNPKQMVITHNSDGIVRYNDEFLRFCGLYGIDPSPCRNYRARTKGKAERPFYYVQEHLLRGLFVNVLSEFDIKLKEFMHTYNARTHSTLESPEERFLNEKGELRDIPFVEPTCLYNRPLHKVSSDGYISWDGGLYPVPMHLCLKWVNVESIYGRLIRVYDEQGVMKAEHKVRQSRHKGIRPPHPEHEEINNRYREKRDKIRSNIVKKFIEIFGDTGRHYIEGLREKTGPNLYWHLSEIIQYTSIYPVEEVSMVLSECLKIGSYHKNSVGRLLGTKKMQKPIILTSPICPVIPRIDITRSLGVYRMEVAHE
jgi:transposase